MTEESPSPAPFEKPRDPARRIDGWKAIATYIDRDRTTAMRWHEQLDLPVYRRHDGVRAPVYAFGDELDRWLLSGAALEQPLPPPDENGENQAPLDAAPAPPRQPSRPALLAVAGALAAALLAGVVWMKADYPGAGAGDAMGNQAEAADSAAEIDDALRERFLAARLHWSDRTAESLARAVSEFQAITREAPDYAPGWTALAESWLLSREFGSADDETAFAAAEDAAQRALAIEPDSAGAHRAMGFLQYWWKNDPDSAGKSFRRALELTPGDAQSHFWYGNILSDNGQHVLGLRHLVEAQTLNPGNVAQKVDYAWALWQAGREQASAQLFVELEQSNPDNAVLRACLYDIALIGRDWPRFLVEYERYAQLRESEADLAAARTMQAAWDSGGEPALQRAVMQWALGTVREGPASSNAWPAMVASAARDREQLVSLMRESFANGERWGSSGYRRSIAAQWPNDSEVQRLVTALAARPVE